MTMNEAIILATELGGAYIAPKRNGYWRVYSRVPTTTKGSIKGLIYVAFDGSVTRV